MALRPRINEFVFNHTGIDTNEYIEIKADPNTDLSAYRLIVIDGDGTQSGIVKNIITPGTTNADGYYVTPYLNNRLENGSQTLLLVEDYTGQPATGADLDTNNDGTLDSTPWGSIVDSVAVRDTDSADTLYAGPILVPVNGNVVGGASRIPDGTDTDSVSDWTVNNFFLAGLPGITANAAPGEALNTPGAANQVAAASTITAVINEFVFNHVGTDSNEFIEVKSIANTDLSGLKLLVIDGDLGSRGVIQNVISVGTTNADGYYVTPYFSGALQNGTQTLLLVQGYTGPAAGTDLDATDDGTLDSMPWTALIDSIAVTDGGAGDLTYAGAPVLPAVGTSAVGGASRIPDGMDTNAASDWLANDFDGAGLPGFTGTPTFGEARNTPGAANEAVPQPPPSVVTIRDIQGQAHVSPLRGTQVQTSGIVTAVDRTSSIGFWIQDPNPDASDGTDEGLFVFTSSTANLPAVGDAVTVVGTVSEFARNTVNLDTTEIVSPMITVNSHGNALPAATIIGAGGRVPPMDVIYDDQMPANLNTDATDFDPTVEGIDYFESLEGMRVTINNAVVIQPTNGFDETWVLADNGAGSTIRTPRGGILLRQNDLNPERILIEADTGVTPGIGFQAKVGDKIPTLTGVLHYDFGDYRIKLTSQPTLIDGGLKQEVTSLKGTATTLTVAEWNVENLDPSDTKFGAEASIIANNLRSPDVLALQEIQDSNGPTDNGVTEATLTAAKLIAAVYAENGIVYSYADIPPANDTSGGEPGGNIRPGFLYNASRVQLTSLRTITDSDLSNGDAFANSRLPLLGTFRFNGQDVTLINVHYSSKGGGSNSYGSVQPLINGSVDNRIAQATETKKVTDAILAADPNARLAVLGDHNEFSWEQPQQILTSDGKLTNLDLLLPENERYTYTFEGNSQSLDHTLASKAIVRSATFDTVHVDSEFPDATRVSDHDPSVTAIRMAAVSSPAPTFAIAPGATQTFIATPNGSAVGGAGADILIAAAGSALAGNDGTDLFTLIKGRAGGTITVADFNPAQDHITLQNYAAGAEDAAYASRTVVGSNLQLTVAEDNTTLILQGVTSLSRSALI